MTYELAKVAKKHLEDALAVAERATPPGTGSGPMGLTPDHVKASPEWKAYRLAYDTAFAALRNFNGSFVKTFKAEIRAERAARRPAV